MVSAGRAHATPGEKVFLTIANAVVALLGLLVIALTLVRGAGRRRPPGT
ncbi:hypothetical protein [Micromonospora sp. NPDC005205]